VKEWEITLGLSGAPCVSLYCVWELIYTQTSVLAISTAELMVTVRLSNADQLKANKSTASTGHTCILLIASSDDNNVVYKAKVTCVYMLCPVGYSYIGRSIKIVHGMLVKKL